MDHGSQRYFLERARFERRLSSLVAAVSLAALALQGALLIPAVRRAVTEPLLGDLMHPRRFGYEGPEQYVARILLETSGPPGPVPGRTTIVIPSMQALKGGREQGASSDDPHARPDTRHAGSGAGNSTMDLMTMARVIYGGSGPIVRSEDFVVEHMERPDYPAGSLLRDSEGLVALGAVVDTTGQVRRVDLMQSPGDAELEQAAIAAARKYRFRPYRVGDRVTEAYAVIRFNFRIYGP
jgi:TonB family protein